MEPVCEMLADEIHMQRKARKLSLSKMGTLAGLSRQGIALVETKQRVPTVSTLARLCRAFGISLTRVISAAERRLRNL